MMIWHPPSPYNRHRRSFPRLAFVLLLVLSVVVWTFCDLLSAFRIDLPVPEVRRHSTAVGIAPEEGKLISRLPLPASESVPTTSHPRNFHKEHAHPQSMRKIAG